MYSCSQTFWSHSQITLDLKLNYRNLPSVIAAVRVADFDGDGIIDLLTLSGAGGPCYTLTVHWVGVADGRIRVGKWENGRGDDKPFSYFSLSLFFSF